MKHPTKKTNKTTRTIRLLWAACAAALVVLIVVAIAPWQKQEITVGEFVPPPFEASAVAGVPDVDESLGWSELAIRQGYIVKLCGELHANPDGTLPVWLYADAGNDVWIKLRILNDSGDIIGESGLLRPGEYVELVQLSDAVASGPVTLHIMGYEPKTYYSAGAVDFQTLLTMAE